MPAAQGRFTPRLCLKGQCGCAWAQIESPIPQDDAAGNAALRSKFTKPIAIHFGNPPHATVVREQCADGYVVGGPKNKIMEANTLAADANMTFWLQLIGAGLTTTWAAHLGSVLSHASWPAVCAAAPFFFPKAR